MNRRSGFSLIPLVFFMALMLIILAFLARITVSDVGMARMQDLRLKAFYAADGGAEWAKAKLAREPSFFTDLPHSPSDDVKWLIKDAAGFYISLNDVKIKVVREQGKNTVYSVGFVGEGLDDPRAVSIIKMQFSSSPFAQISWVSL